MDILRDVFNTVKSWVTERAGERTTADGAALIGLGAVVLLFPSIVTLAAWAAILYGVYTLVLAD